MQAHRVALRSRDCGRLLALDGARITNVGVWPVAIAVVRAKVRGAVVARHLVWGMGLVALPPEGGVRFDSAGSVLAYVARDSTKQQEGEDPAKPVE